MKIVISSGHGLHVAGASGIINEVTEARRVVDALKPALEARGVEVTTFHDDVSTTQEENLDRIVDFHNSKVRDLDVSIHFNASEQTSDPVGTEVFYETIYDVAANVSEAIAAVGFKNRGAKKPESELYFLNHTAMPAILVEVCFVDSSEDCRIYEQEFDNIIKNVANLVRDMPVPIEPPEEVTRALFHAEGTCSWFGGPTDQGVAPDEGLAFHYEITTDNEHLFLPFQPPGTSGLARRLNQHVSYLACRWDYDVTSKAMLAGPDVALVRATRTGRSMYAIPADWGPHEEKTGRVADLSPSLMLALGIETDDEVEVIYPWSED